MTTVDSTKERAVRPRDDEAGPQGLEPTDHPLVEAMEGIADYVALTRDDQADRTDTSDIVQGDIREAVGYTLIALSRDLTGNPASREWLYRPRSKVVKGTAFLFGSGLTGCAALIFGPVGMTCVGYLLSPVLGPAIAYLLGVKASDWRRKVRSPLPPAGVLTVVTYFLIGVTLPLIVAAFMPTAWRGTEGLLLIGPIMAVAIGLIFTPLIYVAAADPPEDNRDQRARDAAGMATSRAEDSAPGGNR